MGRTGIYACGESVSRRNSLESVALFSLKQEAPTSLGGSTFTADILEKAGIVENDSFIAEFGESRIAGINAGWPRAEITIERISDTMHPCYTTNPKLYKRAIAGEYDEWSDRK